MEMDQTLNDIVQGAGEETRCFKLHKLLRYFGNACPQLTKTAFDRRSSAFQSQAIGRLQQ